MLLWYVLQSSGGSKGGAWGAHPPLFWVKKITEEKPAGQATPPAPPLAQGLDLSLQISGFQTYNASQHMQSHRHTMYVKWFDAKEHLKGHLGCN